MDSIQTTTPQSLVPTDVSIGALEAAVAMGDFARLTSQDRLRYLAAACQSVGLNPLTKPIDIINIGGKVVLYANKGCAEQLRKLHNVSIAVTSREQRDGCYVVTVRARDGKGREDESLGAVPLGDNMRGEALALAMMKAETKAKRRVTLSICGLGMFDASEVEDVPKAVKDAPSVVLDTPTAADSAKLLNAAIAPKPEETISRTIEVEVVKPPPSPPPESKKPEPPMIVGEPAGSYTPPAKPEPAPSPAEEAFDAPEAGTLPDELLTKVENAIGAENATAALRYLRGRQWLKPAQGLDHLSVEHANKILATPARFLKAVNTQTP